MVADALLVSDSPVLRLTNIPSVIYDKLTL